MDDQLEQIVNYVWINEQPFPNPYTDDTEKLCGIPLHYIDRALHNAKRYPDAQFNIWVDWRFLDASSKFWVESHVYFSGAPNIQIKDLCDIDEYNAKFDFEETSHMDIWARVDYARLLVLKNELSESPWCQVFYSDFDANNVDILKSSIKESLLNWGVVIATTACNPYENSFFGFSEKGIPFLKKLLTETHKDFSQDCDGYGSLARFLKDENFIEAFGANKAPIIAKKEMPISLMNKIKPKTLHCSLGIC